MMTRIFRYIQVAGLVCLALVLPYSAAADPIPANADLDLQATFSPAYSRPLFLAALSQHLGPEVENQITLLDSSMPVEFFFHGANKTFYSQTIYRTDAPALLLFYNISDLKAIVINTGSGGSSGGGSGNVGMYAGIVCGVIALLVGVCLFCYFCKPCSDTKKDDRFKDAELLNSKIV